MTEAAVLFKQTGASDEDAAKLAQLANLYMNVADNEMTAADASAYITSQMKAFKITANDAISILDKTNEVSNKFAVSSSDISRALTTSSASLAVYGNDINDTIALVTAGTEIMTGKAQQVGRGLRSIGANIAALASSAGELEFQVNGATKTISLIDEETGDMINTFEALSRIHEYWDEMTASEQAALATTLAGKTQLDVFSSTLSNFNTAIEANTVAVESNGSAWEENNKRADSISAKLNILKSQFQELVLGKGGLQDFAKGLLDVGIGALQLVNNLGGLPSVITAITTAIIALNATKILTNLTNFQDKLIGLSSVITNFGSNLKSIVPLWQQYYAVQGMVAAGTATTATATEALNLALTATAPILQLVALAIGAVVVGINAHNKAVEEAKQKSKERNAQLLEEVNSLKQAKQELQNESISRNELNSIISENLSSYKDEIDQIEDVNEARKKAIDLIKEESKEKIQQYLNEGKQEYKEAISAVSSSSYQDYMTPNFTRRSFSKESLNQAQQQIVSSKGIKELTSSYENYLSVLNEEIEKVEEGSIVYNDYREEIYRVIETLSTLETDAQNYKDIISAYNDALVSQGQVYDETTGKIRGITTEEYARYAQQKQTKEITDEATESMEGYGDAADNANDSLGETDDYLKELAKQAGVSEEELTALADSLNTSVESIAEWLSGANDFSDSLSDLSSAYETLKEAADEYNSTGVYSAETMSKLLSMSPELVASLQEENGQLVVNEAVLQNAANAMIDEAEATLLTKAQMEVANIMAGAFDETLVGVGNDAITTGTNVATAGQQALQSGMDANTGAEGWLNFWSAATEGQGTVNDAKTAEAMARAEESYKKQYEALEELRGKVGQYGKASASAHSKAAKSTDSEKSAVDSLKDKYKTVIDFILKQYDKQIDKIKEAKDAAIKSVESQIKALEKEKDSKVKAIDAEITALQRERDAREKYWQDQLDKLEKENNERERNIALQEKQQALALAQQTNVMVLKDGQFQYTQDETAVAGAEQDLAQQEDTNEYERQKELIEELRDTELEWYDERIQALEDYKEQVEEYYEEQIEQLEEYKEYLEEYYEAQIEALEAEKEAVNETLEEGAANQQEYWDKMKEQLQAFVEEWNALVGTIHFPMIEGNGKFSFSSAGDKMSVASDSTGDNKVSAYASGKGSIGDSEIAVVGENPKYRELVIGSKLNNDQGVVMSLKRGSGVVNAGATNTLASIFNSLNGQKSVGQPVSNNSQSMSIQIGSISLPEVKDGQGFVDYLQNFSADITQQSFRRA